MGIKDLFKSSKTKEKEAFVEEAKEAAKGKLAGKAEQLAKMSQEKGVHLADDKTQVRKSIYNKAAGAAKGRGRLTKDEAAELSKIQKFLDLKDDQVEKPSGTCRACAP